MNLSGQYALVTGAGRGIGKGIALELAREGANLVINDRPDSPDLQQAKSEIEQLGVECWAIPADVFSRPGCETLVEQIYGTIPGLDILVSNPAFSRRGAFLEYDPEIFEQTIQATLTAGFHISQLVAQRMVAQKRQGTIVFISSVQAYRPYGLSVAYNAAKAGLDHMATTIAVGLAQHRINVNVIEPGWIETPGEVEHFGREKIDQEAAALPWGRLGTPADIGHAVTFLASEKADYITGTVLRVDGAFVHKDCVPES